MIRGGPLVGCEPAVEGKAPLRILGETAYPLSAPSARVRLANFVPFLSRHGVLLDYRPMLTDADYRLLCTDHAAPRKAAVLAASALRLAVARSDGYPLLVHRLRLLNPVPGLDPPRRLDAYDLDDALFLGSPAEVNRRFQWAKQEARRCIACMRRARVVVAGNEFLATRAREYGRRVEVVPTCVDPERQPVHAHHPGASITIGWIGSHTTAPYLEPVLPALAQLAELKAGFRLVVVGGDTGVREPWIEHVPWSLAREPELLASFDIGIMPLPDTDWARGKCGHKLLQYFSAGVPAVASPVGVSSALISDERGMLASSPVEWRRALEELARDAEGRRQRGEAAREFARREYSYQRWAPELARLLRSLAG